MKDQKYKAVVVGCGKIGILFESDPKRKKPATHAGSLISNKKTELIALVDNDPLQLKRGVAIFPWVRGYAEVRTCLEQERPDLVVIATAPETHAKIIEECLRQKISMVLCEKPLCLDVDEAKKIASLLAISTTTFVLNYQRRFFHFFSETKARIAAGAFGHIQQVTGYYSNGLYNNGSHLVDAITFLLTDDIEWVSATKNELNRSHPQNDLNAEMLLGTGKKTVIALQSFDQAKWGIHELRLYGEQGAFEILDYGYRVKKIPIQDSIFEGISELAYSRAEVDKENMSMVEGSLQHLIWCHEEKQMPMSGIVNGSAVLSVLAAARESIKNKGARVQVLY